MEHTGFFPSKHRKWAEKEPSLFLAFVFKERQQNVPLTHILKDQGNVFKWSVLVFHTYFHCVIFFLTWNRTPLISRFVELVGADADRREWPGAAVLWDPAKPSALWRVVLPGPGWKTCIHGGLEQGLSNYPPEGSLPFTHPGTHAYTHSVCLFKEKHYSTMLRITCLIQIPSPMYCVQ